MRCGFISVIGFPNAGKSTLLNALVGGKVSITSPKAQTTRKRVLGIVSLDETQFIFIDTPGLIESKRLLEQKMNQIAWKCGRESDLILYIHDVSSSTSCVSVLHKLKCYQKPIHVVLNKIDLCKPKNKIISIIDDIQKECPFVQSFFPISAVKSEGIEKILPALQKEIPENEWFFSSNQMSDLTEKLWCAELTREQLYYFLNQELPYQTYIETERFKKKEDNSIVIHQCIFVEKESQKSIVVGKNGSMIKKISMAARKSLETELSCKVHLFLYVKYQKDWSLKPWLLDTILN